MKADWESPCGRVRLWNRDCREVLPFVKADACVTDPPYGCDKASWDGDFFGEWYPLAKRIGCPTYVITGSAGLKDSTALVGEDFVDVISARNLNGMTRGPIGFGNWIACVVANGKPIQGPNTFDFTVNGDMPNHPSPKPLSYMLKLLHRITREGDVVCDPMFGSGTTGVAAVRLGRSFLGIEIDPSYFQIAKRRIQAELDSTPLLDAMEASENQTELFTEGAA